MTFLDRLNSLKCDFMQNWSGGKFIKFQQSSLNFTFWMFLEHSASESSLLQKTLYLPMSLSMSGQITWGTISFSTIRTLMVVSVTSNSSNLWFYWKFSQGVSIFFLPCGVNRISVGESWLWWWSHNGRGTCWYACWELYFAGHHAKIFRNCLRGW